MATLFVVSGEGFLHVVPFDQRATFFEQQPTILRPGNLIRAADSHQSTHIIIAINGKRCIMLFGCSGLVKYRGSCLLFRASHPSLSSANRTTPFCRMMVLASERFEAGSLARGQDFIVCAGGSNR